jgi:hypothetical protein
MSGFLSALAGVGAATSKYGDMLAEQNKMNWQSQREQAAYERQLSLEKLRAKNTAALQGQQQTFTAEQNRLGREQTVSENQLNRAAQAANAQAGRKHDEAMLKARGEQEVSVAKQKAEAVLALKNDEIKARREALHNEEAYLNADPKKQELMDLSVEFPSLAKVIAESGKGTAIKVSGEDIRKVASDAKVRWDSLDKNSKAETLQRAANLGLTDPERIANMYADMQVEKYLEQVGMGTGGAEKATSTSPNTKKVVSLTENQKKQAQANPSAITQEDIDMVTNAEDKNFLQALMQEAQKSAEKEGMLKTLGSAGGRVQQRTPGRQLPEFFERILNPAYNTPDNISEAQRRSADIYK